MEKTWTTIKRTPYDRLRCLCSWSSRGDHEVHLRPTASKISTIATEPTWALTSIYNPDDVLLVNCTLNVRSWILCKTSFLKTIKFNIILSQTHIDLENVFELKKTYIEHKFRGDEPFLYSGKFGIKYDGALNLLVQFQLDWSIRFLVSWIEADIGTAFQAAFCELEAKWTESCVHTSNLSTGNRIDHDITEIEKITRHSNSERNKQMTDDGIISAVQAIFSRRKTWNRSPSMKRISFNDLNFVYLSAIDI